VKKLTIVKICDFEYEGNFLNVTHLKLDLISANVTIVSGDKFQIESSSLEDKITIKNQNGFLKIEKIFSI